MRSSSEYLATDETLYPYRGEIVIHQYNPNQPSKYGILYRSISDSCVSYTYYILPYVGKPEELTDDSEHMTGRNNYTKYLVEGLEQHVNLRGRNISIDRYFTSMTISEYLLDKGMTVGSTMPSDRAGIQKEMKWTKSHESPCTLYA